MHQQKQFIAKAAIIFLCKLLVYVGQNLVYDVSKIMSRCRKVVRAFGLVGHHGY